MSDQLDLFAGTTDAPPERKPKRVSHKGIVQKSGFTVSEEEMITDLAKRWECSGAREGIDNDLIKFRDGERLLPLAVLEYHALIKKVMRNMGVNAKHYEVDGYGTTKMGIMNHDSAVCLKFNHRETKESIYIEL